MFYKVKNNILTLPRILLFLTWRPLHDIKFHEIKKQKIENYRKI